MGIALSLPKKLFWRTSTKNFSPNDGHNSRSLNEATDTSFRTERISTTSIGSSTPYSIGSGISTDEARLSGRILDSTSIRIFTYNELKKATKNFNLENSLGHGGFGTVLKGWVDQKTLKPTKMGHGMVVAVKKMNSEGRQGFQEWQSEVNLLGSLSHPNLVKLLGYCWDKKGLLLVYEFMAKGSLENHLFRQGTYSRPLPWDLRMKIAIDAARGLAFLHSSDEKIIYRDFKASNILLDSNYNAKISDFGLAKNGPSVGETHVSTRVVGTIGYAAPEYVLTGHLYVKSDVYGFGVVLLELLTGQRAYDTERSPHRLVEWAKQLLSNSRKTLPPHFMDPQLEGRYSSNRAGRTAGLALRCVETEPNNRPSMNEVLGNLELFQYRSSQREIENERYRRQESPSYRRTPLRNRSSNLSSP